MASEGDIRRRRRGGQSVPWGARIAWVVLLVGLLGSGVAARYRGENVHRAERAAFRSTAADVSAAVADGLKRDVDLISTLRTIATLRPGITTSELQRWHDEISRYDAHGDQFGTAVINVVPARDLAAFSDRFEADPVNHALTRGAFRIVPAGRRQRYCLISAWLSPLTPTGMELPFPLGLDFCAASSANTTADSVWTALQRDVETRTVNPLLGLPGVPAGASLILTSAVYRRGAPTDTPAQRQAAIQGWIGTGFELRDLLPDAIGTSYPSLIVDVHARDTNGLSSRVASTGSGRRELTYTRAVSASSQWAVVVRGNRLQGSAGAVGALTVFFIGAVISLLAFLLVRRIGHARDHAVKLLQERDGELLRRAVHDDVTGLHTRALALENANARLERARRRGSPMAMLLIDLDNFKRINATYTSRVGDELLRAVAQRLTATAPETDFIARSGGDEFTVLTSRSESGAAPQLVAERLLAVLRAPFDFPGHMREPIAITASIGIAFGEKGSVQDLQRGAAAALAEAKAAGKDRVVAYDSSVHEAVDDRLALEHELPEALRARQFVLHYEPVVDLRSGQVRAMETHLRWDHPTRGVLDARTFMTLAEDGGLAAELNRWILEEACRQGAAWERDGHGLIMSVNVSARQLERRGFIDDLERALTVSGITPALVAIDIPERAVTSAPAAATALLESIKSLGAYIAIDQFGSGYANPQQLRRLPIDAVKIDASFLRTADGSPVSPAVFGTLVELAESLGALVIARSIDTPEALSGVCRARCGYGQGPFIADPMPQDDVNAFLADWPESNREFERHRATAPCAITATPDETFEVIVVDDHLGVRKGIELLLRSEGFRIAGLAAQVDDARELLARRRHDVALISVHLGTDSALPLVEELLREDHDAAIVLYTGAASAARIKDAVAVGTRGFVLKSSSPGRLIDALRSVATGGTYVDPDLATVLSEDSEASEVASLSPRELEMFTLLAEGLTGQAIAQQLYLSPETVKTHIRNATAKLDAKTRVQAVALVVREAHPV